MYPPPSKPTAAVPRLLAVLLALSVAPAALAQPLDTETRWGEPHALYAEFVDYHTYVPAPRLPAGVALRGGARATFAVEYVGFEGEDGEAARGAFQAAVDLWAAHVESPVPIMIRAEFRPEAESDLLGSAAPRLIANFSTALDRNTFYPTALANALEGRDLDAGEADVRAAFNSNFSQWYFGTDGNPPTGQFDFVTVALHEIAHGLGFVGSMQVDGDVGRWGFQPQGYPAVFDRFTETDAADFPPPETPLLEFDNPSVALGLALQSTEVYFDGPAAVRAQVESDVGGSTTRPKLHAPAKWRPGSSYAHLTEIREDDGSGPFEPFYPPGSINSLMTPTIGATEVIRTPGPVVCGMFQDVGWRLGPACSNFVPPPPALTEEPLLLVGPCIDRGADEAYLGIFAPVLRRVRVNLYDTAGRRVAQVFDGSVQPTGVPNGYESETGFGQSCAGMDGFIRVSTAGLASGMYFLHATTDGAAETAPLVVIR